MYLTSFLVETYKCYQSPCCQVLQSLLKTQALNSLHGLPGSVKSSTDGRCRVRKEVALAATFPEEPSRCPLPGPPSLPLPSPLLEVQLAKLVVEDTRELRDA